MLIAKNNLEFHYFLTSISSSLIEFIKREVDLMFLKNINTKMTVVAAMAFGLMLVFAPITSLSAMESDEVVYPEGDTSIVTVRGEGTVEVEPDLAYLTLGVETSSEDVSEAQDENSEKMEAVVDTLHDMGLDEQDIRVGHYSIGQQYVHPEEDVEPEYEVTNQIDITVTDLDQVGPVLEASVEEGVNNVMSLEYGVEDEEEFELEALDKAMKNAETKANRIAEFQGKSLGEARQVNEGGTSIGYTEMDLSVTDDVEQAEMEAYDRAGLAAEPGEVTFEADVDVLYEME